MINPTPEFLAKLRICADIYDRVDDFDREERWLLYQWFGSMEVLPQVSIEKGPASAFKILAHMEDVTLLMKRIGFSHASLFNEVIEEMIATVHLIEAQGETQQ